MPEPWFWTALLVTSYASCLRFFVPSNRKPEGYAWLRLYFHILRHPLQAVRDYLWWVLLYIAMVAMVMLFFLISVPIAIFSGLLLGAHATSVLVPGWCWVSVVLPILPVIGLVRELRSTGTSPAAQHTPEAPAAEPQS